jgi:hypothetical protein
MHSSLRSGFSTLAPLSLGGGNRETVSGLTPARNGSELQAAMDALFQLAACSVGSDTQGIEGQAELFGQRMPGADAVLARIVGQHQLALILRQAVEAVAQAPPVSQPLFISRQVDGIFGGRAGVDVVEDLLGDGLSAPLLEHVGGDAIDESSWILVLELEPLREPAGKAVERQVRQLFRGGATQTFEAADELLANLFVPSRGLLPVHVEQREELLKLCGGQMPSIPEGRVGSVGLIAILLAK